MGTVAPRVAAASTRGPVRAMPAARAAGRTRAADRDVADARTPITAGPISEPPKLIALTSESDRAVPAPAALVTTGQTRAIPLPARAQPAIASGSPPTAGATRTRA